MLESMFHLMRDNLRNCILTKQTQKMLRAVEIRRLHIRVLSFEINVLLSFETVQKDGTEGFVKVETETVHNLGQKIVRTTVIVAMK